MLKRIILVKFLFSEHFLSGKRQAQKAMFLRKKSLRPCGKIAPRAAGDKIVTRLSLLCGDQSTPQCPIDG